MVARRGNILSLIYRRLYRRFGPQSWWPATPLPRAGGVRRKPPKIKRRRPVLERFEVIVGAILTQNTNWGNVERAIANLKNKNVLSPRALDRLSREELAQLIRPAGYFNIKAQRLKNFLAFFFKEYQGSLARMQKEGTSVLRERLLSVNGIGPETADSILLYALDKPVFVVDAYTKRIFSRHGIVGSDHDYHRIQDAFIGNIPKDLKTFNEYHALIVRLGKDFCRTQPKCDQCPLRFLNDERRYLPFRFRVQ